MRTQDFDSAWLSRLRLGLGELGLAVGDDQQFALLHFLELLQRWSRAYNLTAVRDPVEMIPRHLLDSLSAGRYLQGNAILDVGTGAGVPGIPLAVTQPGRNFTLLDSNGKKTRFVQHVVRELGLGNVDVIRSRVEDFSPVKTFDTIIVRAFAPLSDILQRVPHLFRPGCRLLAMKGMEPERELNALPTDGLSIEIVPLKVPLLDARRHLVLISSKTVY